MVIDGFAVIAAGLRSALNQLCIVDEVVVRLDGVFDGGRVVNLGPRETVLP